MMWVGKKLPYPFAMYKTCNLPETLTLRPLLTKSFRLHAS